MGGVVSRMVSVSERAATPSVERGSGQGIQVRTQVDEQAMAQGERVLVRAGGGEA